MTRGAETPGYGDVETRQDVETRRGALLTSGSGPLGSPHLGIPHPLASAPLSFSAPLGFRTIRGNPRCLEPKGMEPEVREPKGREIIGKS